MRLHFSYIKLFVFLVGQIIAITTFGQDFSNKGREFWVGYGSHVNMYNSDGSVNNTNGGSQDMVLYFTSDQDADVTVEIPNSGWSRTYKVFANQVTTSEVIPKTGVADARITGEGKFDKSVHITSNVGIIAYTHIYNSSVSGASLLFPVSTLGRDYYSVNYTQVSNARYSYNYSYVIATEDNTNIEIIPSVNTFNIAKGDTLRVTLNKGEIYNIFGKVIIPGTSTNQRSTGEDLTGTRIRSVATSTSACKKIAVFSGSGKLSINCSTNGAGSSDNYIQQAFPSSAWGRRYLTMPTNKMPYNFYRIIVNNPNTKVKLNGAVLSNTSLVNNFYYEFSSNIPNLIESDLPIMVAQYISTANSCGNNIIGGNGDPEVIYLSPIEQTINKVTINSTNNFNIGAAYHFANIVIPKEGASSLKIDGVSITGLMVHPQDDNYVYFQPQLTAGSHTISSDSGFNAIAYGFGNAESYGYNAGTNVKDLYQTLSVNNQYAIEKNPITCKGSPFKAAITLPYKPISLKWKVKNYNDFVDNAPVPFSDTLINGKQIFKYILDTNIIYNTVGTFNFQVIANNPTTDGCSGEQEINFDLIVIAPPDGNFNFATSNCIQDSVSLSDNTPVGDKPVYKYFWDLGDTKFIDTIPVLKFKPNREGDFNIRYVVANTIGCLSDTISKLIKIDSAINVNFNISKITCQNKDIEFFDLSKARGISQMQNWFWDYGDGSKVDTMTASIKMKHQYANLQNYQPILTVQTTNGCINKHTISFINNPNPQINVQLPEVCLADAAAKFMDATIIADNSTSKFSYLWNFNDSSKKDFPNPTLLIPNALTAKNPEVKYLSPGKYVVSLRVTQDDSKCVDSARFSFTVNGSYPKPLFYILKDTALCSNEFVEIRDSSWVDIGSIGKLNIYWGDGSDTTVDDPSINKIYKHFYKNINAPSNLNLNYTIKINASSGGVCQTAISNSLSIVPPPEYPIITTIKDYLCKSDTLLLNVLSKGGAPPFVNSWTSDNTNASIDNAKSLIFGITPGQVQASLKVMDSKKCVYPYPSLAFFNTMLVRDIPTAEILPGDSIICNGDAINIAGAGKAYDNGPISTYSWYRNDTLISTLSTNSITNNMPGWYKLTVNDGKCNSVATAGKKVSPLNITKYNFSHVPNICIGVPLIVTTNAVDQYNVHYNWDFGDGFNYLKASPGSHKYMEKGDYKIKLNVTNDYCPRYNYIQIGNTIKVLAPVPSNSYKFVFLANQDNIIQTKTDPGYVVYKWTPNTNLNNYNIPNPVFNGDKYASYNLTRTDTVSSCYVIDEYEIVVTQEVFVNVPNAFTPNNDGLNDILKVECSPGVLPDKFEFKIYNRWGRLMFLTTDKNKGWDGRDSNGVLQEMDGYNYVIDYQYNKTIKNASGQFETVTIPISKKTGTVILFR